MLKKLKTIIILSLTALMITLVGCGMENSDINENNDNQTQQETTSDKAAMSKEEYAAYLEDRYDYYLDNNDREAEYETYNIYDEEFSYLGSYDEFITGYNQFVDEERANLEALKKDLETQVIKGNPEVDAINDEVITAIDKALLASDKYGESFKEKAKDYGSYTKDEVIKGLRDLGRAPYEARKTVEDLVDNIKDRLEID